MEVFIIHFFYCYLETTKRWLLSSPVTISMRSVSCNLWGILHFLIYLPISVSDFDLTFRPLAVIHRLLFCKGIAGGEHGKHRNAPYWRKTFHDPPKSQIAVS